MSNFTQICLCNLIFSNFLPPPFYLKVKRKVERTIDSKIYEWILRVIVLKEMFLSHWKNAEMLNNWMWAIQLGTKWPPCTNGVVGSTISCHFVRPSICSGSWMLLTSTHSGTGLDRELIKHVTFHRASIP